MNEFGEGRIACVSCRFRMSTFHVCLYDFDEVLTTKEVRTAPGYKTLRTYVCVKVSPETPIPYRVESTPSWCPLMLDEFIEERIQDSFISGVGHGQELQQTADACRGQESEYATEDGRINIVLKVAKEVVISAGTLVLTLDVEEV